MTPLRRVLLADAVVSGAMGLLLIAGSGLLTGPLGLPEALLRGAGWLLLPFVAFVGYLATRDTLSRPGVWLVVIVNALWVVDSGVLLLAGWVQPTPLGYAFVAFQALAVAAFAGLQRAGLRQATRVIA
ncbi:MAG: hypothetical protein ACO1SV_10365 [Fimbriimonas sp.]